MSMNTNREVNILTGFYYGGDYNPEQWPEEVWEEDVKLMRKAGINLVTVGVFSWALLQSDEKTYTFKWLDRVLDLLYKNGIYVDLATATSSQPPWMSKKYPEILPVNESGIRLSYGSRQTYCPNNPDYRNFAVKLVTLIAKRYKDHPALTMWHVNNEYGCHTPVCYCDTCGKKFVEWLKTRYSSIENLNSAWGTSFWSQYYHSWDEIIPPRTTSADKNPVHVLDYKRFMSDSLLELYIMERDILKEATPDIPVTTNFIPDSSHLDLYKWAKEIDIMSYDSYPDPLNNNSSYKAAFNYDLMRSLKKGKKFLIMEQAPGQVNWRNINKTKAPGVMRLWSYQAIAHGSRGIMFFQWRQSRKGAEKFHSGIIGHNGIERSRVFREVSELGTELASLSELVNTHSKAQTAIIFDFDTLWAMDYKPRPTVLLDYKEQVLKYYRVLFGLNIPVDIISQDSDLSQYKVIIAPIMYMVKAGLKKKLTETVRDGTVFITTFSSGIVDENDCVFAEGYPGPLTDILGIQIEEYDVSARDEKRKIEYINAKSPRLQGAYQVDMWYDFIHTKGAEVLAVFKDSYFKDKPAITENILGKGSAYYIGTNPEDKFLKLFLLDTLKRNGIKSILEAPKGIEAVYELSDKYSYIFALNHNNKKVRIKINDSYLNNADSFELLKKQKIGYEIELEPYGVSIIKN